MPVRDPECLTSTTGRRDGVGSGASHREQILNVTAISSSSSSSPRAYVPTYAPVKVNVYRLFEEGKYLEVLGYGIHHSGVEIYGLEHGYGRCPEGTGLFQIIPRTYCVGEYKYSITVGMTRLSEREVEILAEELAKIDTVAFGRRAEYNYVTDLIRHKYGLLLSDVCTSRGEFNIVVGPAAAAVDKSATAGATRPSPPSTSSLSAEARVPLVGEVGEVESPFSSSSSNGGQSREAILTNRNKANTNVVGGNQSNNTCSDRAPEVVYAATSSPPRPGTSGTTSGATTASGATVKSTKSGVPAHLLPYDAFLHHKSPYWKHNRRHHHHLMWLGSAYHLLMHNCNNFSEVFSEMLITFTPYVKPPPRHHQPTALEPLQSPSPARAPSAREPEGEREHRRGASNMLAQSENRQGQGGDLLGRTAGVAAGAGQAPTPLRGSSAFPATPLREEGIIVGRGAVVVSGSSSSSNVATTPPLQSHALPNNKSTHNNLMAIGTTNKPDGHADTVTPNRNVATETNYNTDHVASNSNTQNEILGGGVDRRSGSSCSSSAHVHSPLETAANGDGYEGVIGASSPRDYSPIYSPAEGGGREEGSPYHGEREREHLREATAANTTGIDNAPSSSSPSRKGNQQVRENKDSSPIPSHPISAPHNEAEEILSLAEEETLRREHIRNQIFNFIPRKSKVRTTDCGYGSLNCLCRGCCSAPSLSSATLAATSSLWEDTLTEASYNASCWYCPRCTWCVPSCVANCCCGGCCCAACCPSCDTSASADSCCWGEEEYWFVEKGTRSRLSVEDSRHILYSRSAAAMGGEERGSGGLDLFGGGHEIVTPSPAFYDFFYSDRRGGGGASRNRNPPNHSFSLANYHRQSSSPSTGIHHHHHNDTNRRGSLLDLIVGGAVPPPIQHRPFPVHINRASNMAGFCLPAFLIKKFDDYDIAMQTAMNDAFLAAPAQMGAAMTPGADMMV